MTFFVPVVVVLIIYTFLYKFNEVIEKGFKKESFFEKKFF